MLGCFSFCIHDLTELYEIMGRSGFLCVHVKFPSPPPILPGKGLSMINFFTIKIFVFYMKNPRISIDCIERRIRYVLCINLIYFFFVLLIYRILAFSLPSPYPLLICSFCFPALWKGGGR